MDRTQVEIIENLRRNPAPKGTFQIQASAFTPDPSNRTLLWGYTVDRDSFHVYLLDGIVHRHVYHTGTPSVDTATLFRSYAELAPNKRLYPEACDFDFCRFLVEKDVHFTFTNFQDEREAKQFYGLVA